RSRFVVTILVLDLGVLALSATILAIAVYAENIERLPVPAANRITLLLYPASMVVVALAPAFIPLGRAWWTNRSLRLFLVGVAAEVMPVLVWTHLATQGLAPEGTILDFLSIAGFLLLAF